MDHKLVMMFLFAALEREVYTHEVPQCPDEVSVYERCGMGAYEVALSLSDMAHEMLAGFDRERPFSDLLYTDCDNVAVALYIFMREQDFMPTSLNALEL